MANRAEKPCPACGGAGEKYTGVGAFKFRGVCSTCHGKCYLPADHSAFAAIAVNHDAVRPIES